MRSRAEALIDRQSEPSLSSTGERLAVTVAREDDRPAWDAFVSSSAAATGYHAWAWREVFRRAFGHESVYLVARCGDRIAGVLPLVEIRSRLFGRSLTSLPFVNYGGVAADSDEVARALVAAARDEARRRGAAHVELRHTARRFADLPCRQHKVSMRLPLGPGMWEVLDRKVRNQIRKAEKSGLSVEDGGAELLDDFYRVFARNMRDLGTPVYARRFFAEVLRAFPDRARVVVVRLGRRPVAAGITYRTGRMVEVPWASSIRDFNSLCPNHLLYWSAIEWATGTGCDTLDFGRSTPDEGTYHFKAQWGAAPVPLYWEYCLLDGESLPDQSPKNPKFRLAIAAWKRCPLWLANTLGPHVVRGIP
jgi:FemAB-related protein (PEP-CTERM system-associated)